MNECTVQHWFKMFLMGYCSLEDKEGRGRDPSFEDDALRALVGEISIHPFENLQKLPQLENRSSLAISRQ